MKVTPWIKKRTNYGRFELDNWVRYTDDYISVIASIIFVTNIPALKEYYSSSIFLCHRMPMSKYGSFCYDKEFSNIYKAIIWSDLILKEALVDVVDPLIFDL